MTNMILSTTVVLIASHIELYLGHSTSLTDVGEEMSGSKGITQTAPVSRNKTSTGFFYLHSRALTEEKSWKPIYRGSSGQVFESHVSYNDNRNHSYHGGKYTHQQSLIKMVATVVSNFGIPSKLLTASGLQFMSNSFSGDLCRAGSETANNYVRLPPEQHISRTVQRHDPPMTSAIRCVTATGLG